MRLALYHGEDRWTPHRHLADDEHDRLTAAIRTLTEFQHESEIFQLVVLGWGEFQEVLQTASDNLGKRTGIIHIEKLRLNRVLLNLIASTKAFVDHTTCILSRRYGSESEQAKRFDRARRVTYDSSFAYRFYDKLRNYVIHQELPITGLHSTTTQDSPEAAPRNELRVTLSRDRLLEARDAWSAKVRSDIEAAAAEIDVPSTCQDLLTSVLSLADVRFAIERAKVESAVFILEALENELTAERETIICIVPDNFGNHSAGLKVRPIPRGLVAALRSALAEESLMGMVEASLKNPTMF